MKRSLVYLCLAALAVPVYAARPQAYTSSVKYRDAGAKPATGRSGSAAIQARALRGQFDTEIEVTTGEFDSAAAPVGKLDKVQLKLLAANGDVAVVDNYRKGGISGGFGSFNYDWPARGTAVQVQANVSGIDPSRSDVVTAGTTVVLRPDLAVSSFAVPQQAYVGASVTIAAVVREINGDLGAHADCVLKADGTVVDQVDGIWVDAGDSVTCQFRTTFATVGAKGLTVEVANVAPGDYNTANNIATASINIVSPTVPVYTWMQAEDSVWDSNYYVLVHQRLDSTDPANYPNWVFDRTYDAYSTQHTMSYLAQIQTARAVRFPAVVESSLTVDGQAFLAPSFTVNASSTTTGPGTTTTCGEEYDGNKWVHVCNEHFDATNGDVMTVYTGAQAGSVTYGTWAVNQMRYPDLGQTTIWTENTGPFNSTFGDPQVPRTSLGNNVAVRESVTDAVNTQIVGEGTVQLYPFPDQSFTFDYGCTSYTLPVSFGTYSGSDCRHQEATQTGTRGFTFVLSYQ